MALGGPPLISGWPWLLNATSDKPSEMGRLTIIF
jgi:hypothetical protein